MKRRHTFTLGAGLCLLLLIPLTSSAAEASSWSWGSSFRIGPLHFRIGQSPHHHRGSYFRVGHHIESRYRCTNYCFADRGSYYHHDSCPVVRGYLRHHGYSYSDLISHYGPYRSSQRYERRERADRYYSYPPWFRWQKERHRERRSSHRSRARHRHDRHCPDWHFRRY